MINNLKKKFKKFLSNEKGEFGISALLSIAIALMITVFVLVPGIRGITQKAVDGLDDWWDTTIENEIFATE
ncbi:MAG: hypothetical protein KAH05_05180 [Clostridiales bacterium]|jgi:hypothetical protein|nr:hypothetical protein [Clostridiales bacterium]